ncbi:MAG: matrixin family metalloprotease [Pirellulales bacterium]
MPANPRRFIVFLATALLIVESAAADVIVLANRTPNAIPVEVKPAAASAQRLTLASGDSVPVFVDGRAYVSFASREGMRRYLLDANSAYYFGQTADGRLDLQEIGLGDDESTAQGRTLPGRATTAPIATIPVKILVDEEEPARQLHWERRLRERVEAASAVLEQHARVRLKVVAVGNWDSDDATTDFFESLAEFERDVKPFPAQLAIGFTSQYQVVQGRTHMAGTRGALHSHILVREWSQHMSEPERLELLVHELGHFLGASHSPEPDSVMRPVLGDRQAVRKGFRVRFDPVNTLVMSMVGEELRRRKIRQLADMTTGTKLRLRQIYQALSPTLPQDPAANQFVQRMEVATVTPLLLGTKQVVAQVVRSAQTNLALPAAGDAPAGSETRREGDALTEYYVRNAAGIARFLPDDVAGPSFLMGLGIALDDSTLLRDHPKFSGFVQMVEPQNERSLRLASLGAPTLLGRRDLAQHFFVSAHLAAIGGTEIAAASGLAKELSDAGGGSGFSFADMAANRAGILFAGGVMNKRFSLRTVADEFTVPAYMPTVDDLPEGLTAAQLLAQFGPQTDDRFRRQLQQIDQRLLQLPTYRNGKIASQR